MHSVSRARNVCAWRSEADARLFHMIHLKSRDLLPLLHLPHDPLSFISVWVCVCARKNSTRIWSDTLTQSLARRADCPTDAHCAEGAANAHLFVDLTGIFPLFLRGSKPDYIQKIIPIWSVSSGSYARGHALYAPIFGDRFGHVDGCLAQGLMDLTLWESVCRYVSIRTHASVLFNVD